MPEPARKKSRSTEPQNLETLMGNKPPQALDVEEAVLGAMLVEPATSTNRWRSSRHRASMTRSTA